MKFNLKALLGAAGICHVGDGPVQLSSLLGNPWQHKAAGRAR